MSSVLISIVTVVFNAKTNVLKTLKSIQDQTYRNIEYIVVDGGSTDGTIEILKEYQSVISKFVSEKDEGLYDAMNKGQKLATGDFIFFMNAGDTFVNNNVIENVVASITEPEQVYYGNTIIYFDDTFKTAPLTHHQSTFFPKSFYSKHQYDTKRYKISAEADYIYTSIGKYGGKHIDVDTIFSRIEGARVHYYNSLKGMKTIYNEVISVTKDHGKVVPLSFKLTYPVKSLAKYLAFKIGGLPMVAKMLLSAYKPTARKYSTNDLPK